MIASAIHPDADTLSAFVVGRLPVTRWQEIEDHVVDCARCGKLLREIGGASLLGLGRQQATATPAPAGETVMVDPELPKPLIDHPRYRLIRKLGSGGMGVVYLAEHRIMGRTIALKVLSGKHTTEPDAIERFRREVRLASRLSHPNVVAAHDADEAGGLHFLVMEYVDGISLDQLVAQQGPLPIPTAVHFARQAALGLQHAYEKGMVHRDVKPHNLMVTRKGHVKVLDFGLACVARGEDVPESTSETAAAMTAAGMVLGTPDFLAPEQARNNGPVDHRADLYGLGCTLFFLLTGRPPFVGTSAFEKLIAHVDEPAPDIVKVRKDVPAGLSAIIRKLMAKSPEARYQTPAELATALAPFLKASADPAPAGVALPARESAPLRVTATPVPGAITPRPRSVTPRPRSVTPRPAVIPEPEPTPRARKRKKPTQPVDRRQLLSIGLSVIVVVIVLAAIGWIMSRMLASPAPTTASTDTRKDASGQIVSPPVRSPDAGTPSGSTPAAVDGRRVLIVLPGRDLNAGEYESIRTALERGRMTVTTAGPTTTPVARQWNSPGDPVPPDIALASIDPDQFVAILFLGGGVDDYGPGRSAESAARRVVDGLLEKKKLICASGTGMKVLGDLGYLKGHIVAGSPIYTPPASVRVRPGFGVIRDLPFLTAGTDRDAPALAAEMIALINTL